VISSWTGSTTATVEDAGCTQLACHSVQPGDRVAPRPFHPGVGVVVIDGVGDEQHRTVGVVQDREVGGEDHRYLRQVQVVAARVGHLFPPTHGVVRDGTDQASSERRQAGDPLGRQGRERVPHRHGRVTVDGDSDGRHTDPVGLTVSFGEGRGAVRPDDGVARPHSPVLRRLEQERARLALGQFAVDPERRLPVGEQAAHDGDDPSSAGQARRRRPGSARWCRTRARRGRQSSDRPSRHSQRPSVEAGPVTGVTRGADLVHPHEEGVAVAVQRHRAGRAGRAPDAVALAPVFIARARPEGDPACRQVCWPVLRRPSNRA
jgi:hypothetical protein